MGGTTNAQNATAPPTQGSESTGINWLLTWLGEAGLSKDELAANMEEQPSRSPAVVHWLTVHLPSAPGIQTLLAESDPEPGSKEESTLPPAVAAHEQSMADTLAPIGRSQSDEETKRDDDNESSVISVAPVPLAPPPPLTADAPVQVPADAPITASKPGNGSPDAIPAEAPTSPLAEAAKDKGEVVWTADLVVSQPAAAASTQASEATAPQPQSELVSERSVLSKHSDAPGSQQDLPADPGTGSNEGGSPDDSSEPKKELAPTADVPSPATKTLGSPVKKELDTRPGEHAAEPPASQPAVSTARMENVVHSAEPSATTETAAPAATVPLEPAQPIRPAQVATLQVDVPSATGVEGAAPMRLIVSQRGDQVSVRLRSWDSGTTPLTDGQMQPLLDSLSSQGLVGERRPIDRIGETAHILTEAPTEKPPVLSESMGTGNEQQSFQNANDRQQQQQERQQQQQAFSLRKQGRNVPTEEFTLPPWVEGSTVRY